MVRACYAASVPRTLNRDVSFQFELQSNMSTTSLGGDYSILNDNLTIPYGFRGQYSGCINLVVFGDDIVEDDETIAYTLVPLSNLDSVQFLNNSNGYELTVRDTDGKNRT